MSNRKRLPAPDPPDDVVIAAREARCSDCPGRARPRYLGRGEWEVFLVHGRTCPAFGGVLATLHKDAAESVARAARATGHPLAYTRATDRQGEVLGVTGTITTGS